jgi:hypothetical protein
MIVGAVGASLGIACIIRELKLGWPQNKLISTSFGIATALRDSVSCRWTLDLFELRSSQPKKFNEKSVKTSDLAALLATFTVFTPHSSGRISAKRKKSARQAAQK